MSEAKFLPGGSGGVWKIRTPTGEPRVHRPTGPWTQAVHELLEHLNAQDLDGIPHVFGIDDEAREVLSYLPGDTLDPETEQVSDAALAQAAAWMRRFHDAVDGFEPVNDVWRQGEQPLAPGEIICHNDPGLYNWVMQNGEFVGMIDWDRAGPGIPTDDLAFLCWSGVPLLRVIPLADVTRRLKIVADAYGGVTLPELLDAVTHRMGLIAERWRVGLENGDPGTVALRDAGIMARHEARVTAFEERIAAIREATGSVTKKTVSAATTTATHTHKTQRG